MSIDSGLRQVTDAVRERIPELYELIRTRLRTEAPEYSLTGNESLSAAESEAIAASLRDVLDYIADGRSGSSRASNETLREVRLAARAGASLQDLLLTSRVGQSATWEFVLEEAHRLIDDPKQRTAVLRRASANHFNWNELVSAAVVEAFEQESSLYTLHGRERRKLAIINALLADQPVDTSELEYVLERPHLAAHVWDGAPEHVARAIRDQVGVRPLVVVNPPEGGGFLWIPWSARQESPAEALGELKLHGSTRVAFGAVGDGLEGFRVSYRQAGEARAVAEVLDQRRIWYDNVALEALAMHDLPTTRAFVREELNLLGETLDPGNVLIETLRMYFAVGENAATTARALGVHNRTVAYRLRSVEAKLGAAAMHREELVIAVRLAKLTAAIDDEDQVAASSPALPSSAL